MTPRCPPTVFKKNGTLHLKRCAQFYGVRPGTIRVWSRCGAPLLEPDRMGLWRNERNRVRFQKIGRKNNRHADKQDEIVRLYLHEKLGLRAIARYFSGRPTITGIRNILIGRGVYRGSEVIDEQTARSQARRLAVVASEKETRHRIAVCLWKLRGGTGVETTCRKNGWNQKSIWNVLGARASYRRFKARQPLRWPDKRACGKHYSRIFTREKTFQDAISKMLTAANISHVRECRLPSSRTRVDFKLPNNTFVECKVGVNAGQVYEFIGQATHYRGFANRVILCIPSDVKIREDLHAIIAEMDILICNEQGLGHLFSDNRLTLPPAQVTPQTTVRFVCKCCGSSEKRRHRMNSYCVDCAPRIPQMRFDARMNRWVGLSNEIEAHSAVPRSTPSKQL